MEINLLYVQLLLTFFPGVLCAHIVDTFTNHPPRSQFQFIINSFLLGIVSYLIYALIVCLFWSSEQLNDLVSINTMFTEGDFEGIQIVEIVKVSIVSIVLGLVLVVFSTYKLHFYLLQKCGITRKFGEQDVWGYFFNSSDNIDWVTVRDRKNNLIYTGFVRAFSDNATDAELLMEQVSVYENISGKLIYNVDVQYVSLEKGNISIEVNPNDTFDTNSDS